jgi:hypothetical protein
MRKNSSVEKHGGTALVTGQIRGSQIFQLRVLLFGVFAPTWLLNVGRRPKAQNREYVHAFQLPLARQAQRRQRESAPCVHPMHQLQFFHVAPRLLNAMPLWYHRQNEIVIRDVSLARGSLIDSLVVDGNALSYHQNRVPSETGRRVSRRYTSRSGERLCELCHCSGWCWGDC